MCPRVAQGDLPPFETLDDVPPMAQGEGLPTLTFGNAEEHFLDPLETLTFVDRIAAVNYAKLAVVQRLFRRTPAAAGGASLLQVARLVGESRSGFPGRHARQWASPGTS